MRVLAGFVVPQSGPTSCWAAHAAVSCLIQLLLRVSCFWHQRSFICTMLGCTRAQSAARALCLAVSVVGTLLSRSIQRPFAYPHFPSWSAAATRWFVKPALLVKTIVSYTQPFDNLRSLPFLLPSSAMLEPCILQWRYSQCLP